MAGFNSPNILFLNTYDSLDRKYIKELVPKLKREGYERYVELYAGSFVMPLIVASEGIQPKDIFCYDISLFSNILGYVFSNKDVRKLQVKKNGILIELESEDNVKNGAVLLYEQALARLEKAENIIYFKYLVQDMKARKENHIKNIEDKLRKMNDVLNGLNFETLYIWEAFDKEKNSENTFIVSNPPTYKGAYEKFFDTNGVITWIGDNIEYEIWDGSIHCKELLNRANNANALLLFLQQANKGNAAMTSPVSARYLSATQNVYWNTNKPDIINKVNGKKEETANESKRKKSKFKILPFDYVVTKNSKIEVFVEESQIAEYYRNIWLHRITGKSVSAHLCVVIDGFLAGFIGIDLNAITRPYNDNARPAIILSYAVSAPNIKMRMARLFVSIAKSKKIICDALSGSKNNQYTLYATSAEQICTVEYSRFHEVKGLRGLMKLEKKDKINENLFALKYYADLNHKKKETVLKEFIDEEERYKKCKKN